MLKYIKGKLLKKEAELIYSLIINFNQYKEKEIKAINLIKETLEKKENDFNKRVKEQNNKIKKNTEKKFKEQLLNTEKKLKELVDFDLLPGNETWGIEPYSNNINKIKIDSILITKDDIEINHTGFYQKHFFKTEKEAIVMYNNILEKHKKLIE